MIKNLLFTAMIALLVSGCIGGEKKEEWTSFIYPDKENTKRNVKSPMTFATLEECTEESIKQMKILQLEDIGVFKCGLNCSYHEGMQTEVCAKMLIPAKK